MAKLAIMAFRAKEIKKTRDTLNKRAEELRTELEEINKTVEEDVAAEEQELTAEEVDKLEEKADLLEKELDEKDKSIAELEKNIAELEEKIAVANKKNEEDEKNQKEPERSKGNKGETRTMAKVTRGFFNGLDQMDLRTMMDQEEVKSFVIRTRELIKQERAVTGAELAVPKVFLGILRDEMNKYSKLLKHVNLKPVKGTARAIVSGAIPEAVWTEMCANLNELAINFNEVQVDGYKVGGYIAICNATLADSDIDLADEIMTNIAQAIGFALDKAILYGKGVKMPVGIATRLAELAKPAYWGVNEPSWTDLHVTNVKTLTGTGLVLFKAIFGAIAAAKGNFSTGDKFFAMNESTYRTLQMEGLSINVNGAIVSAVDGSMPFVGGKVELFDFIPDGDVIGGYGSNYLLVEREGATLESSRHAQFIQQNTVFLGTARYDGRPVFGNSFVLFNIKNVAPTAVATFIADSANA